MSVWQGRRVVVCVGTGGVGKTTTAAAIGIAAAASGLRTLVMTIDPARRLANAMGIEALGNKEHEIPASQLEQYGVKLQAPLWVMMPDVKRTFDDLIERSAPDSATRERIMNSRFYQHFTGSLAGSHEYAAVEKLYEVYASGRYDLIVLDTPPSQNATDFLDAPGKVLDFLDNDVLQWLLKPYVLSGKVSLKILEVGTSLMLSTLGRIAGGETLRELAEFVMSFQGMYDDFRARSRQVKELIASEALAFVLVTSTAPTQHAAMFQFRDELREQGLQARSVIINRVRQAPLDAALQQAFDAHVDTTLAALGDGAAERVRAAARQELQLGQVQRRALAELQQKLEGLPMILLPELPTDVHDLAGLAELQRALRDT